NVTGNPRINGVFTVTRTGPTSSSLDVLYAISGTAINGTDYDMLSGTQTIQVSKNTADIPVVPIDDSLIEFTETVTLTLLSTTNYVIGSPPAATVSIADGDTVVNNNVTNLTTPIGIDYHSPSNSLI